MTLTATIAVPAVVGLATAGSASAAGVGPCPSSNALGNFKTATNVAASFENSGTSTSYTFSSLVDENPVSGVPGLVKYCVYPSSTPVSINVTAKGANGVPWTSAKGTDNFAFTRPTGNPSNIPLDGKTTVMGTASWTTVPQTQTILLHIADPTVCANLYPGTAPSTCFVKPSTGAICNAGEGDTTAAYNAMPFGVIDCFKPSLGFEATSTNEFGDRVGLAGTAKQLASLKVLFASWACQSGHWFDDNCATAPGATFTHPITANIYAVDSSTTPPSPGALLSTVTVTQTIPYRPSADTTGQCLDTGQWFNPQAPAGERCTDFASTVLTFTFPAGTTLPPEVIWTVAFNTTHYGYAPIGEGAACFTGAGGCPYDSLNVGAESYPNAPYAGTDVSADEAFRSVTTGGVAGPLQAESGWAANRPLGEIITTP